MHGYQIPKHRLKSRNSFLKGIIKINKTLSESRLWKVDGNTMDLETNSKNQRLQTSETLPSLGYNNK